MSYKSKYIIFPRSSFKYMNYNLAYISVVFELAELKYRVLYVEIVNYYYS